jgi:hypothetical protein
LPKIKIFNGQESTVNRAEDFLDPTLLPSRRGGLQAY